MRRQLESIEIPGETEARARAWNVVSVAFADRQPVERPSRRLHLAVAVAVAGAALAAVLSSPGQAVLDEIRETVGVERAQPALFSLPSPGQLLVASDAGLWVVQEDGSKRLLGPYREGSWSPFGRFVVAARENELAALEPDGEVRWTLSRPGVRFPRWAGSETDTRIAYIDRTGIRIVAGDGTGDRLVARGIHGPIAWSPGSDFVLAYVSSRSIHVVDVSKGRILWRVPRPRAQIISLAWSRDGRRLLVQTPRLLRVYAPRARLVASEQLRAGRTYRGAEFRPTANEIAVTREGPSESRAYILDGRQLGSGLGSFDGIEWSSDGRWLLVTWPTADQWILIRASGREIRAVSNVAKQFRSDSFPRIEGWCCSP